MVSRSLTPTDVPIVHGSPTSSALRLSLTELPAMFTHVPDASAPTRLSALSDVPAYNYAADFSGVFILLIDVLNKWFQADTNTIARGGSFLTRPPFEIWFCYISRAAGSQPASSSSGFFCRFISSRNVSRTLAPS